MKKATTLLLLLFIPFINISLLSQTLTQADFTSEILPQYMASGTATRIPVVFKAKVQNLTPNTTYRFFIQAAKYTDLNLAQSGAGNTIFLNPDSSVYGYTSGASVTTNGGYRWLKTDDAGACSAWFSFINTGNARFTAGIYVIPTITLGDSALGTTVIRKALNDSILVLGFATTSTATSGTGIWGISGGTPRNIVLLYNNVDGTGKPLAITYLENDGLNAINLSNPQYYTDSVNSLAGRWGTIIPNVNANGVKRIEQRSLIDGTVLNADTASTGVWPSGANTVNPAGGTTAVGISALDAPLPVELTSFTANVKRNNVSLNWITASEKNNQGFAVLRKSNDGKFEQVGFVKGKGTTTSTSIYSYNDQVTSGKYIYKLKQVDFDGSINYSGAVEVSVTTPNKFGLNQNYPNPFNPTTTISFTVDESKYTELKVFNILGQAVQTLFTGIANPDTEYKFNFNGSNLSSGIYFYKLTSGSRSDIKRMILMK